jgi:hypothetical protein
MRTLIVGLVICVAGCGGNYENGSLGFSKRGPIEHAESTPDHSSVNTDNQRHVGLQLQNAEYNARTTPMLEPSR